ncbi:MAG: hypothetical protein ABW040_10755 [Microbacteriaceae bacterium]
MHDRYIRAAWAIVFSVAGVGTLVGVLLLAVSGSPIPGLVALVISLLAAALVALPVLLVQASIAARTSVPVAPADARELV